MNYILIDLKEKTANTFKDKTPISKILNIHINTVTNRLKRDNGFYINNNHIIAEIDSHTKSDRGWKKGFTNLRPFNRNISNNQSNIMNIDDF